jgi:hypothetical protein
MSIDNKTITVIITTYQRFKNLDSILQAWKSEPVEEVWLIDGSGKFIPKTENILLFSMPKDFGTRMDYSLTTLVDTDLIILADDDVLPKSGFTLDLYNGWKQVGGGIVGIIGRVFKGPHYRKDTVFYKSNCLSKPVKTDFVGVVYLSERNLFGFDTKGMHNNCDDLWWQMKIYPDIKKHVVPSKNYIDLPEATDKNCMFNNSKYAEVRQEFYKEYYYKNYLNNK